MELITDSELASMIPVPIHGMQLKKQTVRYDRPVDGIAVRTVGAHQRTALRARGINDPFRQVSDIGAVVNFVGINNSQI